MDALGGKNPQDKFSFKPKKFRWNHTHLKNPAKESNCFIRVMLAASVAPLTVTTIQESLQLDQSHKLTPSILPLTSNFMKGKV